MKDEDVRWKIKTLMAQAINDKIRNSRLPYQVEFQDISFNQDDLFDFFKDLENVGVLEISRFNAEKVRNPDIYSENNLSLDLYTFDLKVKRAILEEDYKILRCGSLSLNLVNGKANFRNVSNFKEGTKQYNLLKLLLSNPNVRLSYEDISKSIGISWNDESPKNPASKEKIIDLMREVRTKLGMKEKDLVIEASNGYRLNCK